MHYDLNAFGLREKDMEILRRAFESIEGLETALLFGSRSRGAYKPGSDVDLALKGSRLTLRDIWRFQDRCETDTIALLHYDVVHYDSLQSLPDLALKASIDRDGIVVYEKCSEDNRRDTARLVSPSLTHL
jgi:predicted nucleotidyltransferase